MDVLGYDDDLDCAAKGIIPGINSIDDVKRTIVDVMTLSRSLRWLHWSSMLLPLPAEVAQALDRAGTLETLIVSDETAHWEVEMSEVPMCVEKLFFDYSPLVHCGPKKSMFAKRETIVPTTPWLSVSEDSAIVINSLQATSSTPPPPPLDGDLTRRNGWIQSTRQDRIIYWLCNSVIRATSASSSRLKLVGLSSAVPLRLPLMLPVWLILDQVVHVKASGIILASTDPAEEQEVTQRGIAIMDLRQELKSSLRQVTKEAVKTWAQEEVHNSKKDAIGSHRQEMAGWILEDDRLCSAVAKSIQRHDVQCNCKEA
ncbi:hypothetical protein CBS101457_004889 [Exobasidium rhododendri]|nr:hypothetical protein CBS101457_004889 [Exobasidium rhododendri]